MAIDTIIFDLGNVLIQWDPRLLYRKIFKTEAEIDTFLENICTAEWNMQQDAGRPVAEATEQLAAAHPEWADEIRAYYGRWPEMLGGPIPESVEVLEQLKRGGQYRLLALTNWSAETFPIARERYDFLDGFEGILVSGEEKLVKPDPAIYQLLFDRYGVEPTRAVFIDDSEKNVMAARELGVKGIHFASPMQMREELADALA